MIRWLLIASGVLATTLFPLSATHGQNPGKQKYKVLIEKGPAYWRVTVTTDPAVPVKQTETFQVVCTTNSSIWRNQTNKSVVYHDLEIATGQVSGTTDIYTLKNLHNWGENCLIHIEQDNNGRFDGRTDLCVTNLDLNNNSHMYPKTMLVVSSNISAARGQRIMVGKNRSQNRVFNNQLSGTQPIPNVEKLNTYFGQLASMGVGASGLNSYSMLSSYPDLLDGIPLGSLPRRWMGLYNVELILISLPDLKQACQADPAVRDALRQWLTMGGTLVVNDCGADLAAAPQILPTLFGPESALLPQQKEVKWSVPSSKLKSQISQHRYFRDYTIAIDPDVAGASWRPADSLESERWVMAPYLLGHVLAVSDDMSQSTDKQWQELVNAHNVLKGDDWQLDQSGMINDRSPNRDFQIPSVGEPPVIAFQLLLALFVILAGPVFYLVFRRIKKMHLLLFATPLLSLIACLGMFLFAILNDGFSRQGRVHSVTFLNQSSGDAVTFARHALYAGTQPSGYLFNNNTLVMDSRRDNSPISRFRYGNDQLILSGGDIKARTKHQVATHEPFEAEGRLNFIVDKDQSRIVQNLMETDIVLFCMHTKSGWYVAQDIAENSSARCETMNLGQVSQKIRSIVSGQYPDGPKPYSSAYSGEYTSVTAARAAERMIDKFWNGTWDNTDVRPGQYIAILKQPLTSNVPDPEVEYKTHELHIVIGTL
ncbi:MAG: hypothetical protein P8K79_04415 [Mariniblastus sp.]|nr:hypothetical protein [Mariniblastus sp.]